jgi:23S rRNA pseudouridine2605 synthase
MLERLQKIIARAGVASRRHAEELISSGHVTVNGRVITELGSKADEARDHIKVSGKLLRPESERVYLLLHKPPEVVSTMSDPEGRRSLRDLLYGVSERVFPVGRLEYHAAGLVFLTNDGDLANRIMHSHTLPQTYLLKLKSLLTFQEIESLARATGAKIERLRGKDTPWYEVTLSDAARDDLRNRLFQTGHPVERTKRIRIGNLELESLAPGRHRLLSPAEVSALARAASSATGAISGVAPAPARVRPPSARRPYKPKSGRGVVQNAATTTKSSAPPNAVPGKRNDAPREFAAPINRPKPSNPRESSSWRKGGDRRPFSDRGDNQKSGDPRNFRPGGKHESRPPFKDKGARPKPGGPRNFGPDRKDDSRHKFGGKRSGAKSRGPRDFGAGRKEDSRHQFGGKRSGTKPGGSRNSGAGPGRKRDDHRRGSSQRKPGGRFSPKDSR